VPDWKYYVTSLVAVFLALGIGILIGSMVVGSEAVLSQQSGMLARLEADLLSLKEDNTRLRQETEQARQALERARILAAEVLPSLLDGRLRGAAVTVVAGVEDRSPELEETLRRSGALLSCAFLDCSRISWPEIARRLGASAGSPPERLARMLGEQVGRALTGELSAGDLLEWGRAQGWWSPEGQDLSGGALVILEDDEATAKSPRRQLLLSLAGYWHRYGGPVVAATPSEARTLVAYHRQGATTVGHVQEPWGRAAVVAALLASAPTQ
jgi:hypothetical protein